MNKLEILMVRSPITGILSIVVGAFNVLMALYVISIPAEQRSNPSGFYDFYISNPYTYNLTWGVIAITGLLCVAAIVPAVNAKLKFRNEWTQISSVLAMVGFAIMALKFFTLLGVAPEISQSYMAADVATKKAISAQGLPQLDPHEWLAMFCPGIWFLTVNSYAFIKRRWNRVIAAFGMLLGAGYLLVAPATIFKLEFLDMAAAGLGAIAGPVWFIAMGIFLLKGEKTPQGF